jgi:large subunit ribosomal protein L6
VNLFAKFSNMSRIGKKPTFIPAGVAVEIASGTVVLTGPKGKLSLALHPHAQVAQKEEDGKAYLEVTVNDPEREDRAIWGTTRALLAQMVTGVTEGYSKALELNGVGFKMALAGQKITMSLGFSHEVVYTLPAEVAAKIEGNVLTLSSIDAQKVGKVAAEIRALKKPEPYKGKGFRYTDEIIIRKAGKAAKGDK